MNEFPENHIFVYFLKISEEIDIEKLKIKRNEICFYESIE